MSESRAEYVKILDVVHGEGMENPDLFNLLDDMIGKASKLIELNLIALEVPQQPLLNPSPDMSRDIS